MRLSEVGRFGKEVFLIADKECHDWSGWDSVGLPTIIIWSVVIPILRYVVFK